ncbi:MAG: hypothetical protein E6J29_02485, partial [Chloroflexi bacterium]
AEAVVLAGDVFDRDLPGQPEAARLAAALAECAVPVLVAPGTHDAWRAGGVWDRPWPANVTVFSEDRWTPVAVGEAAFYGLASRGRAREGGLFGGLPARVESARFHVGVAHASLLWADIAGNSTGSSSTTSPWATTTLCAWCGGRAGWSRPTRARPKG